MLFEIGRIYNMTLSYFYYFFVTLFSYGDTVIQERTIVKLFLTIKKTSETGSTRTFALSMRRSILSYSEEIICANLVHYYEKSHS